MKVTTAWVAPPKAIGGLDHLGTQAPCVLIYAQLLPGITNVTDRARYYSFYPWLLWSFYQHFPEAGTEDLIEHFRRADCLFTLIAERHARVTDQDNERHSVAMVGRIQLVQAMDRLDKGEPLRLSEYSAQGSTRRYFMNPLGGLGQYYAGTLADLQLVDPSAKPWIKYTIERGEPLAKCVEATTPAAKFWRVVSKDDVTVSDLDELSAYCPCRLVESADECNALTDLYFDRSTHYGQEGLQRRRSLGLILNLTQALSALPGNPELTELVFRACNYSGRLPGGSAWVVPDDLIQTQNCWATYERSDLLSVAFQTVFSVSLRELQPQYAPGGRAPASVEEFAASLRENAAIAKSLASLGASSFRSLMEKMAQTAPSLGAWQDNDHEVQIAQSMVAGWGRGADSSVLLAAAIKVLALLAARDDTNRPPYGSLSIPYEALEGYPINLASFRSRCERWNEMGLSDVAADLVMWCLNTHLHVALRKLRQTGRSTFHMRPSERGIEVVGEIPPPANTTPRFRQAVQILRDIGALHRASSEFNRQTVLSNAGSELLEFACA